MTIQTLLSGSHAHLQLLACLILTWQNEQEFIFLSKIRFIPQCTLLLARYNESNDHSTFLCLANNTICQTLQNTLLISIQFFRSTQNSYNTAISWGLGTDNSRWWPGLENTVDAEPIRNPIHAFLPVQLSRIADKIGQILLRNDHTNAFLVVFEQ